MENHLTPKQVAALAGTHPDTIVKAIRRGDIKAHRFLGRLYIPAEEVRKHLEPLGIVEDIKK